MSFNGRYRKGYMRVYRELKREEAEARNAAYLVRMDAACAAEDDIAEEVMPDDAPV